MKLYLEPRFDKADSGEGGIRRLVEAQQRYLPQFGVQLVDNVNQADLTAGHGGARPIVAGRPFISHSHGLYWSDYRWERNEDNANRFVIDALLTADAITVPSQWVRNAYVRGILRDPQVIYHGIEPDEWTPSATPGNYVLWNKPRHDAVSNVKDLQQLVKHMPDTQFVSTLGDQAPNLKLVGRLPYPQMKSIIQSAGVYLATARETFGIGTLEALASGVPVAGWDYGGQHEIIIPGETGYLATYGDYGALADCVRKCFSERSRLSVNCRTDAVQRWQWPDKMVQYATLYEHVLSRKQAKFTVSVIVTCHNLAKYLPEALTSVLSQNFVDWECIIVDDASTDDSAQVMGQWRDQDSRFKLVRSAENVKLSRARNLGFGYARGKYIINLDADDVLPPNALALMVMALDQNPRIHIAYGSLEILSEDGKAHNKNPFPGQFNYLEQMAHLNQLHYAAMMRREVWEQSGGYRQRMWRAEDAEFWCRVSSFGFRIAKVTEEPTIYWRHRADGKSAQERRTYPDIDGDWTADFPWSIAHTAPDGIKKKQTNALTIPNFDTLPFGAMVDKVPIWHRQNPLVSIIIPLGPGHEHIIIDALDSCIAQTFTNWEVIVVNDTGKTIDKIPGAYYAYVLSTNGNRGAGAARNLGLKHARGALTLFLDADDQLHPDALTHMIAAYRENKGAYVYSGWRVIRPDNQVVNFDAKDYDRDAWLFGKGEGRNIVTVLMATEDARTIGFDEQMVGYEDWDFFCKCAVQGYCGQPLKEILVTYRHINGQRSVHAAPHHTELVQAIKGRYHEYAEGSRVMAPCGGCPNKRAAAAIEAARQAMLGIRGPTTQTLAQAPIPDGMVRMRFTGDRRGPVTYYVSGNKDGRPFSHPYVGANNEDNRFINAYQDDVTKLEAMGVWVRERIRPQVETPDTTRVQPVSVPVEMVTKESIHVEPTRPIETVLPTVAPEPVRSAASDSLVPPPPSEQPAPAVAEAVAVPDPPKVSEYISKRHSRRRR